MPFDPLKPATGSPLSSEEMRGQLNALNDAIAAGQAVTNGAIAGTAQNPSMGPLNIALSDPPTRAEVQVLLDAFNALLNQITRV